MTDRACQLIKAHSLVSAWHAAQFALFPPSWSLGTLAEACSESSPSSQSDYLRLLSTYYCPGLHSQHRGHCRDPDRQVLLGAVTWEMGWELEK